MNRFCDDCHHGHFDRCGGYCGCGSPHGYCTCDPTNTSNRTMVIPVSGASAYADWLAYNPDLDPNVNPDSPWNESYWLEHWVKMNLNYENFEI